jgi:hypothetical protein
MLQLTWICSVSVSLLIGYDYIMKYTTPQLYRGFGFTADLSSSPFHLNTQQIHATQSFFFAGHFISHQFSFLLFKNIVCTAKFILLNSEKIRQSN